MVTFWSKLRFSTHLIFRPFDGFWDLKEEKRGSLGAALAIAFSVMLMYILRKQYTAFLFNPNNMRDLNIVMDMVSVALPFLLWCVANWCLTSLADGEGTFKDIVIASGYALTPLVLINAPLILISYAFNLEEGAFYTFFTSLSILWTAALMIVGTMITHQYSMKKTILTIIGIMVGMAIIIFIGLLFTSVIQQIVNFFTVLYKEITFRY